MVESKLLTEKSLQSVPYDIGRNKKAFLLGTLVLHTFL